MHESWLDLLRLINIIIKAITENAHACTRPYVGYSNLHTYQYDGHCGKESYHGDTYNFLFLATHHNLRMRSFNQPKRRRRQRERAVNDFERAFSEVDLAEPSRIQAARAAAAIEFGGECNPTSGTEGLSEICAAVAAPRRDSATAAAASRDSALNLGDGEYAHSARGTGLSRFDVAVATAFHDSATVTAPPRDSATAAAASQAAANRLLPSTTAVLPHDSATAVAASQDSALNLESGEYARIGMGTGLCRFDATVTTASHDSATVTAPPRDSATAAAASQAAANRLRPWTTVLWTSVDGYSGKFLYLMLLSKSQESTTIA